MNTRKALGIFTGHDAGDTFLSDPRAVEHFSRAAESRQAGIRQRQQEPQVSLPHARLAADKAREAARVSLLDSTAPLVDKFSAYQTAKKYASQTGADGGLRALAQHLRVQWESDPDGFFSAADLVRVRDHFNRTFGRTAAVTVLSEAIPRAGVGDLPVRRLAQMATQIRTQADYEAACRRAGLDGSRPDQVKARAYLRALVRRAAEGDDVMQVTVNEQQGAQLGGIPADDGGGVLSGADLQTKQLHAQASMPTERQVSSAVLDANVVRIAGYSIFINDNDRVELRTPRGASREAPISKLGFVVRDFLKAAQAANFEPSVNEQQEPYVDIDETEGGDVIGKDSTSDESSTNAIVPSGKPKAQHPMQSNSGTSASEKNVGADSAGKNPTWGNPALSGAHASDPHSQSGTSFSDRNLGPDHQQDNPSWENPGSIITSREARLDDSPFLVGSDPAERYRRARANRPSARLLEGIADEGGWLARRVLAQLEGDDEGKGDEAQTSGTEVLKEAARTTVRLRDDVFQIGDGFVDRTADSKLVYTFGYSQQAGQPKLSEMQRYIDTCCGGVRAYRVASLSQVSPGVVRAIVIEAQSDVAPVFGEGDDGTSDPEEKREAVRRAMGKIVAGADFGNDAAGMGSDYAGTVLNKEGAEKMVPNPNPKGRSDMVTESYARAWKAQHGQGESSEPSASEPPAGGGSKSEAASKIENVLSGIGTGVGWRGSDGKQVLAPEKAKQCADILASAPKGPLRWMEMEKLDKQMALSPVPGGSIKLMMDAGVVTRTQEPGQPAQFTINLGGEKPAEPSPDAPALPPAGEVRSPYDKPAPLPTRKYLGQSPEVKALGEKLEQSDSKKAKQVAQMLARGGTPTDVEINAALDEMDELLDTYPDAQRSEVMSQMTALQSLKKNPPSDEGGEPTPHPSDTGIPASANVKHDEATELMLESPAVQKLFSRFLRPGETVGAKAQKFVQKNYDQIVKGLGAAKGKPPKEALQAFTDAMNEGRSGHGVGGVHFPEEVKPIMEALQQAGFDPGKPSQGEQLDLPFKGASRRIADAPEGWEDTVEEMVEKHTDEVDNPFALANWMKDKGYEPGGSGKEGQRDVSSVGVPSGPKEGTQKAIKPVKDVPALAPKGQPKQGQLDDYGPGEFNPYDYDPPGLAEAPAWCSQCGNNRVTNHADEGLCDSCFDRKRQGARISEGWGEGGEYKRDIEAESAQEVWELHRGLGGEPPDFKALQQSAQQQQQQESLQQQQAQMSAPVEPRQDASGKVRLPEPEPETMNADQQTTRRQGAYGDSPYDADASNGKSTWCEECGKTFYITQSSNPSDVSVCEDCLRKKYEEGSERAQDSHSWGTF